MIDVDRAAMALMDKMSTDGHEVNYTQCREYAALVIAAATDEGDDGPDLLAALVRSVEKARESRQHEGGAS